MNFLLGSLTLKHISYSKILQKVGGESLSMQTLDLVSGENFISDQLPNLEIVIQEQRDRPS